MRILVVEDEEKVASFIKNGLEEENYAVDVSNNGAEGCEMALLSPYDLIILDLMLPGKDGFKILSEIRDEAVAAPVLILTARDKIGDKVRGLDLGADDYLTKPFDFEELIARVRALLRRAESGKTPLLKNGELELDPAARSVRKAGEGIELTAKEYALLEYFLRNKDKVLTRTMIAQHVWDHSFDSGTNVIDVYVNYLRKKIDTPSEKSLIATIRGSGYKMRSS